MGFFPYERIRPIQSDLIALIQRGIDEHKDVIAHAPTGLGKTVAALSTILPYAKRNKLKIIFLTSRHTQHRLAIDTCRDIKEASGEDILVADLIGKQWMCAQGGVAGLYSSEFSEYCRALKEAKKCEFFTSTKKGTSLTPLAKSVLDRLKASIHHTDAIVKACTSEKLCPYEMALILCQEADVIVSDYYYMFNPVVSELFLKRAGIEASECIIVVDEAHNLPTRIRDLMSTRITSNSLKRAIREAKKFRYEETISSLALVQEALNKVTEKLKPGEERYLTRQEFLKPIGLDTEELIADLSFIADDVRKQQRTSAIGSIAQFLDAWKGEDGGFIRIAELKHSKQDIVAQVSYLCLDPAVISKGIIEDAHLTILMSGTLSPTSMYRDILGMQDALEDSFMSPFPKKNILNLIIPKTTTKFTQRNIEQFQNIGRIAGDIANQIPGNSIMFFPSYSFRDSVYSFLNSSCRKTIFLERPNLTKEEKEEMLERFRSYKDTGATILAVTSGSFGEGIDLPGDLLKGVVVIGLPLQKPDLRTKALIEYYNKKLGKGWEYGYIFPAFNKAIQSAGRCIRTETDKGAVIFLEERYIWPNYFKCFPDDWEIKIAKDYAKELGNFFTSL